MLCYARSGGTILNQCLGSISNVVILSEVNPLGGGWGIRGPESYTTVKSQAENWYQIKLKNNDFEASLLELEQVCAETNRYLIVRDWTFVNFTPYESNNWAPPNRFLTIDALRGKSKLKTFAFVRNAIDVWLSRGKPDQFFQYYLNYVQSLLDHKFKIFKYEDFCINPDHMISKLCNYIDVPFSDSYKNYAAFDKVNGDVQNKQGSRGVKQGTVGLLPRRRINNKEEIELLDRNPYMIEANRLLGYPTSYKTNRIYQFIKSQFRK